MESSPEPFFLVPLLCYPPVSYKARGLQQGGRRLLPLPLGHREEEEEESGQAQGGQEREADDDAAVSSRREVGVLV